MPTKMYPNPRAHDALDDMSSIIPGSGFSDMCSGPNAELNWSPSLVMRAVPATVSTVPAVSAEARRSMRNTRSRSRELDSETRSPRTETSSEPESSMKVRDVALTNHKQWIERLAAEVERLRRDFSDGNVR